uniref:Uncharacterized protein n=1 Tax=Setaria italica TaxID=4555 RepID=K3ZFY4_SETIT
MCTPVQFFFLKKLIPTVCKKITQEMTRPHDQLDQTRDYIPTRPKPILLSSLTCVSTDCEIPDCTWHRSSANVWPHLPVCSGWIARNSGRTTTESS